MTKEMKAPPKKVGSARSNVYIAHFIRARLIFLAPVPISPGLGLPFQTGRARVKFWFGRDNIYYRKVLYTTKFTRAGRFFGYAYHFYPSPYQKFSVVQMGLQTACHDNSNPPKSQISPYHGNSDPQKTQTPPYHKTSHPVNPLMLRFLAAY